MSTETTTCPYCGSIHPAKCHLVKSYEYHPDGTVKRVEFFSPNDYHQVVSVPTVGAPPITVPWSQTTWNGQRSNV